MFKAPYQEYKKPQQVNPGPNHYSPMKAKKSKPRKFGSCFRSQAKRQLAFPQQNVEDFKLAGPGRYNILSCFRKTNQKFNAKLLQPAFMVDVNKQGPKQYGDDLQPVVYRTLKNYKSKLDFYKTRRGKKVYELPKWILENQLQPMVGNKKMQTKTQMP